MSRTFPTGRFANDPGVGVEYMSLEQAKKIGALAPLVRRNGEEVRVVEIGGAWSRELCGGTHVSSSAQIGPIAITGESSVAPGTRRVGGDSRIAPSTWHVTRLVAQLTGMLNVGASELPQRVSDIVTDSRSPERELDKIKKVAD